MYIPLFNVWYLDQIYEELFTSLTVQNSYPFP